MTPNKFKVRDEIDITLGLSQNPGTDLQARHGRATAPGSRLASEEYVLATGTAAVGFSSCITSTRMRDAGSYPRPAFNRACA
jgi:hypothetical protein